MKRRFSIATVAATATLLLGADFPKDTDLTYIDLGHHALPADGGSTPLLEINVPPGTTSMVAYCGNYGDTALGAPYQVIDPSGKTLYDGDAPEKYEIRAGYVDDTSAFVYPITPRQEFAPGTWKISYFVSEANSGGADCGAVLKTTPAGETAKIGIEFVFVGLGGLDAATAGTHEQLQEFIKTVRKELEQVGITVEVGYRDFPGDVAKYTVLDMSDDDMTEFNALLRQSAPPTKRVISVFLVQEISNSSAGGSTVLGMSAGPPGLAGLPGTSKSGLVVGAIDLMSFPQDVAKILTHELAHYAGLYHTTEKRGGKWDPMGDTPQCTVDPNANGVLSSHECLEDGGANNVMWWTLKKDVDRPLSPEQGWLLRHSPAAE